jgi:hypothetical protein
VLGSSARDVLEHSHPELPRDQLLARKAKLPPHPLVFFLGSIIYRLRNTLNGIRPSWSFDPGPAQPLNGG